jgi:hypothetical protein
MQAGTQVRPKGIQKHVPVRFTLEEYQFLHRVAPRGGIQKLLRSWIDDQLRQAMKAADERCEGV